MAPARHSQENPNKFCQNRREVQAYRLSEMILGFGYTPFHLEVSVNEVKFPPQLSCLLAILVWSGLGSYRSVSSPFAALYLQLLSTENSFCRDITSPKRGPACGLHFFCGRDEKSLLNTNTSRSRIVRGVASKRTSSAAVRYRRGNPINRINRDVGRKTVDDCTSLFDAVERPLSNMHRSRP